MEENPWTDEEKVTAQRLIHYEWKKRKVFYIVMLILLLLWLFMMIKTRYYDRAQLEKYDKYTVAEIVEYHTAGKGQPYTVYKYMVDGEIHEESIGRHLRMCPDRFRCVGAKFKVWYPSNNPDIHQLLLEERLNDSLTLGRELD